MTFQCLDDIQRLAKEILQFSGRFFYQVGQYQDCLQNPQLNYNLINFIAPDSHPGAPIFVGLCLPKTCSKDQIKLVLQKILKNQKKYPLSVGQIDNNVPGDSYPFNWGFYVFILITIITVGLVLFSSFIKRKNKFTSIFSFQESKKIFKINKQSNFNILNGVRAISMIFVVLGHSFSYVMGDVNAPTSFQKIALLQPYYLWIEGAVFAVDIFFYIGGFLLAFTFLKQTSTSKVKYPLAILQRFLRIWPGYFYAILFFYSIYPHLGSGPFWASDKQVVQYCSRIWKPLLFVDNLVDNGQTQCMGWGWYLQNDMQIFIFSIFLLFIYSLNRILSKILIWLSILGSMASTFVFTINHGTHLLIHISDLESQSTFNQDVYIKPWARVPPYLFGLFLGIIYFETFIKSKNTIVNEALSNTSILINKISKVLKDKQYIRIAIQWMGIAIMIFIVMIPRQLQVGMEWTQWIHSTYLTFARLIIVFALTMTIFPTILGCKNSIINFALDTYLFNFIAKISFCTYLIHLSLISIWFNSRTYTKYFIGTPIFSQFCGILVLSLFCGYLMTFLIQIPCSKIQKIIITSFKGIFLKKKSLQLQKSQLISDQGSLNLNKTLME